MRQDFRLDDEMRETFARALARIKAGDRQAIDELVRRFQPMVEHIVRRACWRRLGRPLERRPGPSSVMQVTMLEMARDIQNFKGHTPEELFAWVIRIANNNVRDALRIRPVRYARWIKSLERGLHGAEGVAALVDDDDPSMQVEREEQLERLQQVVLTLRRKHGEIIRMRFGDDMSYAKIGRILKISDEAARKRCQRAIDIVRHKLATARPPSRPKPR